MAERLKITQVKSAIGYEWDQGVTLKALGLGKMWRSVEKDDTPAIRGMLNKVRHLVRIEAAGADPAPMVRPREFSVVAAPPSEATAAASEAAVPEDADSKTEAAAEAATEVPAKPVRVRKTKKAETVPAVDEAAADTASAVPDSDQGEDASAPEPEAVATPGDAGATPDTEEGESSS